MLVAKAPLRVSLLGGGSDYPDFSKANSGTVVGATVNLYLYVYANPMPPFARESFRLTYRRTESVHDTSDIAHPIVRALLQDLAWKEPINLGTLSDVPGGTGLGSSSAFTVALRAVLAHHRGEVISNQDLAAYAHRVERVLLGEPGGIQDSLFPSFGGFRKFQLSGFEFEASPPLVSGHSLQVLSKYFYLVFTGKARNGNKSARATKETLLTTEGQETTRRIANIAAEAADRIGLETDPHLIAKTLAEAINASWELKKSLHPSISPDHVEQMIKRGVSCGVDAAKLLGSGEHGFLLFMTEPENADLLYREFGNGNVLGLTFTESPVAVTALS